MSKLSAAVSGELLCQVRERASASIYSWHAALQQHDPGQDRLGERTKVRAIACRAPDLLLQQHGEFEDQNERRDPQACLPAPPNLKAGTARRTPKTPL